MGRIEIKYREEEAQAKKDKIIRAAEKTSKESQAEIVKLQTEIDKLTQQITDIDDTGEDSGEDSGSEEEKPAETSKNALMIKKKKFEEELKNKKLLIETAATVEKEEGETSETAATVEKEEGETSHDIMKIQNWDWKSDIDNDIAKLTDELYTHELKKMKKKKKKKVPCVDTTA